jgi:ABC-type nitrate/sulfonate/bicarbonate transport system substrate-binding protein
MKLNLHCLQLLVTVVLTIGSVPVTSAAEPKVVNIGWTGGSSWTSLPDRVASERGFYEKEGLRVRYIQFQGTNLMLSALLANELDYVTILPFIAGAATRGLPVKIVAATTKASGYAIVARSDIDSIKALKGKKSLSTVSAARRTLRFTNCLAEMA